MNYKDKILEICEPFKTSTLYTTIVERVEFLVSKATNKNDMIDYLMDTSMNYYKEDPMHMLGVLNLLMKVLKN